MGHGVKSVVLIIQIARLLGALCEQTWCGLPALKRGRVSSFAKSRLPGLKGPKVWCE